jgi:hypothetical protein
MSGGILISSAAAQAGEEFFPLQSHHESEQALTLGIDLNYYNTSSNYSSSGSTFNPSTLDHAERVDARLFGSWGFTEQLSFYGALDLRYAEVDSTTSSAPTGTATGLGDQTIGASYCVYRSQSQDPSQTQAFSMDLQFQVDFPPYGTDPSSLPYLGDGSVDLSWGILANIPLFSNAERVIFFRPAVGYTYRSSGFSSSIPWSLTVTHAPQSTDSPAGWLGSLGLYGIQSLGTDQNTLTLQSVAGFGAGGSFLTNAINPSLITLDARLGYRTRQALDITLDINPSLYGKNSPSGFAVGAGLAFHLGRPHDSPARTTPQEAASADYDLETEVVSVNDSFHLAKISRGSSDGVQIGDAFDIFTPGGVRVAEGRITYLKPHEAALKVEHYFKEIWIEKGNSARRRKNG